MKNFKKLLASFIAVMSLLIINPISAQAEWRSDSHGWWYAEGNSWATGWRKIGDFWYYFNSDGYMLHDITMSGYTFGSDGAWINSQIQSPKISVVYPSNWIKTYLNGQEGYYLDEEGTNVNLVTGNMQGYSEEYYNKVTDFKMKSSGLQNIEISEEVFNNNKARIIKYTKINNNKNTAVCQAFFFNNNTVYVFTLFAYDEISDENMIAFKNMLNTVKFAD